MSADRKRIVVLGLITRMPVAGAIWQTLHYLLGLRRLGYDVYYVEAHGITPCTSWSIQGTTARPERRRSSTACYVDSTSGTAGRITRSTTATADFGMSERRLKRLYGSADLLINLHGGTMPLPEHVETGRLVCLETDPVEFEIELHDGYWRAVEFAARTHSPSSPGR